MTEEQKQIASLIAQVRCIKERLLILEQRDLHREQSKNDTVRKDVVRCYKCNGRGLIYEAESHPTDPDNPSINAETCHVCMGATYLRKDRDNDN